MKNRIDLPENSVQEPKLKQRPHHPESRQHLRRFWKTAHRDARRGASCYLHLLIERPPAAYEQHQIDTLNQSLTYTYEDGINGTLSGRANGYTSPDSSALWTFDLTGRPGTVANQTDTFTDGYRYTLNTGLHEGTTTAGQGIESDMVFTLTPAVEAMFPAGNFVARNLRAGLKTILARQALGLRRQTFFVSYGGWDHHGELLTTQASMLAYLDAALGGFQRALDTLGLTNDVVSFTASDFGRTLRSNGRGTDHAWGGNSLIFGGPVRSGRIHGIYPTFNQSCPDQFGPVDIGYDGRLLTTTSVDRDFAAMLRWFGVSETNLPYVLPNLPNFSGTPALNLLT